MIESFDRLNRDDLVLNAGLGLGTEILEPLLLGEPIGCACCTNTNLTLGEWESNDLYFFE